MSGPHDLLTRYTFEQPERAAAELRAVLPPQVAALVDWSSLQRESGSVVDSHLKETQSDLLFSGRLLCWSSWRRSFRASSALSMTCPQRVRRRYERGQPRPWCC
jgi:hypothetical protein